MAENANCNWQTVKPFWVVMTALLLMLVATWLVRSRFSEPAEHAAKAGARNLALATQTEPAATPSRAAVPPVLSVASARLTKQSILGYGTGQSELGMVRVAEGEPVGPEAFALTINGDVLIADQANHRIQVYGPDGVHVRSMELPGVELSDVLSGPDGQIFVYEQWRHALRQYDAAGMLLSTLRLDPAAIDTRGYFHLTSSSIYFANAAARDVLVGSIADGLLTAPEAGQDPSAEGIHAQSGRVYDVSLSQPEFVRIQFSGPDTAPQALETRVPGMVSARFAGEDQAGRFHVQVERLEQNRVMLEVLAFDRTGREVSRTRLPQNDYLIWTTKLVDVAPSGALVQFLPRRDEAQLNFFAE